MGWFIIPLSQDSMWTMVCYYSNTKLTINLLTGSNGSECSFLKGWLLSIHTVLEKSFLSRQRVAGLIEQRRIPLLHLDVCHGKHPCTSRKVPVLALGHTRKKVLQGEQNPGSTANMCNSKIWWEYGWTWDCVFPLNSYVNKDLVCIRMGKHGIDNQVIIFK